MKQIIEAANAELSRVAHLRAHFPHYQDEYPQEWADRGLHGIFSTIHDTASHKLTTEELALFDSVITNLEIILKPLIEANCFIESYFDSVKNKLSIYVFYAGAE